MCGQRASRGDDRGRGPPRFLPLAWTGHLDSNPLAWLAKRMKCGFSKEWLTMAWLAKIGGCILYQKLLWLRLRLIPLLLENATTNILQSPLRYIELKHKIDQHSQPNQTHPRFQLIVWGSMPLMTVSIVVMTILLSTEVVHISHKSRSYFVARYPLIWWNTLTHFWHVR
jgi:hypothetical protein